MLTYRFYDRVCVKNLNIYHKILNITGNLSLEETKWDKSTMPVTANIV